MAFFISLGYQFPVSPSVTPDGSIILAMSMPMHQLQRRQNEFGKYPHLKNHLFDPQLYLAGLDANESGDICTKLASYPWFNALGIQKYKSSELKQSDWRRITKGNITTSWLRKPPTQPDIIQKLVEICIDFQISIGCLGIILPSPLTSDSNSSYWTELQWLDYGLEYIQASGIDLPVYATVAISDLCLRYTDPTENIFLQMIADSVSARDIDGAYIVFDQSSEATDTRYMANVNSLGSALHLVHMFTADAQLNVIVNYFGPFGLVLRAVGADVWSTNWYKSLTRLRLADSLSGGRAYPSYWCYPAAVDINLNQDMDLVIGSGMLAQLLDLTEASEDLLNALGQGRKVNNVPEWQYRQSNVSAAIDHYLLSAIQAENNLTRYPENERLDYIEHWLEQAVRTNKSIASTLGSLGTTPSTKSGHVNAWLEALRNYRLTHSA